MAIPSKRWVARTSSLTVSRRTDLERLNHRLDAERAGLHRVLEEVRLEEPLAGVDVLLGAHAPEAAPRRPSGHSR